MDELVENLENATLEASQHEPSFDELEKEVAAEVDGVDGVESEAEEEEREEQQYYGHRAQNILSQELDAAFCGISGAIAVCCFCCAWCVAGRCLLRVGVFFLQSRSSKRLRPRLTTARAKRRARATRAPIRTATVTM
jgi:hypothetical protein